MSLLFQQPEPPSDLLFDGHEIDADAEFVLHGEGAGEAGRLDAESRTTTGGYVAWPLSVLPIQGGGDVEGDWLGVVAHGQIAAHLEADFLALSTSVPAGR